jgi:Na+-transporting methylmalonyl-CoA/oxaloacetate decarboxylase gamma subunit
MVFGVLSLLIVVAVIGTLANSQFRALGGVAPTNGTPAAVSSPVTTPQQQNMQLQNQVKKSVEDAMQQARPEADEK